MFTSTFFIISFFLFIIGTCFGSFFNVVVYRSGKKISWIRGRSRCDECGKKLSWYDNIPLLSFCLLKGKSRCCRKSISLIHPVVELLVGLMFVWWYFAGFLFFNLTKQPLNILQPIFWLAVGVILVIIFVIDYVHMIIPDLAAGILLSIVIFYRLVLVFSKAMMLHDFIWSLIGALIMTSFFYFLWWITKGKGFGFGDVKLIVPLSLLMGWPKVILGVFLSFVIGAFVGLLLILFGKKKLKSAVPFGPFMIISTFIVLIWGSSIISWYMSLLGVAS